MRFSLLLDLLFHNLNSFVFQISEGRLYSVFLFLICDHNDFSLYNFVLFIITRFLVSCQQQTWNVLYAAIFLVHIITVLL